MTMDRDDRSPHEAGSQNTALQQAVADRLEDCGHFLLRNVNVEVDNQRVVLTGTVPSYYMKQMAQETARKVCPNRQLTNDLNVPEEVVGQAS
ncbi:MAG: BON domain-containing protein [Rubripirellula sp.]